MPLNLDTDCLRTLAAIADAGTFARAAERVGRTASAVSLQMGRLEARVGVALFRKNGRTMVFTEAGERLLGFAHRILEANDQAVAALATAAVSGPVRLGSTQDFADTLLPAMLGRFSRSYPDVRLEVRIDGSRALTDSVEAGALDLALAVDGASRAEHAMVRREPMLWISSEGFRPDADKSLPLVLFEPPCAFRDAALTALTEGAIDWRVVYTSPSLSGLRAAVRAGLGVTVRTASLLEAGMRTLSRRDGLPALPHIGFSLYRASRKGSPAVERLSEAIVEELAAAPSDPRAAALNPHRDIGLSADV